VGVSWHRKSRSGNPAHGRTSFHQINLFLVMCWEFWCVCWRQAKLKACLEFVRDSIKLEEWNGEHLESRGNLHVASICLPSWASAPVYWYRTSADLRVFATFTCRFTCRHWKSLIKHCQNLVSNLSVQILASYLQRSAVRH